MSSESDVLGMVGKMGGGHFYIESLNLLALNREFLMFYKILMSFVCGYSRGKHINNSKPDVYTLLKEQQIVLYLLSCSSTPGLKRSLAYSYLHLHYSTEFYQMSFTGCTTSKLVIPNCTGS